LVNEDYAVEGATYGITGGRKPIPVDILPQARCFMNRLGMSLGSAMIVLFLSLITLGFLLSHTIELRKRIREQEQIIIKQVETIEILQNGVAVLEQDLARERETRRAAEERVAAMLNEENECPSLNMLGQTAENTPHLPQLVQKAKLQVQPFISVRTQMILGFTTLLLLLAGGGLYSIRTGRRPVHDLWCLTASLGRKSRANRIADSSNIVTVRMTRGQLANYIHWRRNNS
jgi:hypothetical protein